ncbi:MAG: hypothetical protein ABJB47_13550, partial [Actinomycetota bacterium]
GGVTVDVDDNSVRGKVASARATHVTAKPALLSKPDAATARAGKTSKVKLTIGPVGKTTTVAWTATPPAGMTIKPSQGTRHVRRGHTTTVTVSLTPSQTLPAGRYDIPVSATAGTRRLTETFELVSVTNGGAPPAAHSPIVAYAADPASLSAATTAATNAALPATSVTGNFAQAWSATRKGAHLVIAVGQAAANALASNPCSWPGPSGKGVAAATAFSGRPLRQSPGAGWFELGDGRTPAVITQLLHYAMAGTLPGMGAVPAGPLRPTSACLGAPSVSAAARP